MDDSNSLHTVTSLTDGVIDHADGSVEIDGYFFEIDWDELDPPVGHPDAQMFSHEEVMAEIYKLLD